MSLPSNLSLLTANHINVYLVIFSLRMRLAPAEHVMSFLTIFDKPEVLKRWRLIEQEPLQSHQSSWNHFIWRRASEDFEMNITLLLELMDRF